MKKDPTLANTANFFTASYKKKEYEVRLSWKPS
jgi:hypothetical protein